METKCSRPDIGGDIPFYLNDTLSEERVSEVEEHLTDCQECNEALVLWVMLMSEEIDRRGNAIKKLFSGCNQPGRTEDLIRFVERKNSPDQDEAIKTHLGACADCRSELSNYFRSRAKGNSD